MRPEIIFTYNDTRCHAKKVEVLLGDERYIGEMDGYEIWQINNHGLFDQFGFVAVRKEEEKTTYNTMPAGEILQAFFYRPYSI
jgi:hypothetical protein